MTNLNWSGSEGEDFVACAFSITIHIEQNVNPIGINTIGGFSIISNLKKYSSHYDNIIIILIYNSCIQM